MGADLLIVSLACQGDSAEHNDMQARLIAAKRAVSRLTTAEARRLAETISIPQNDKNQIDLVKTKQMLRRHIATVLYAVQHGRRDVTVAHGGVGIILYLTGGLSWGDSPCDSYDAFQSLAIFPGFHDARDDPNS